MIVQRTPWSVFCRLIEAMQIDNGCAFCWFMCDFEEARPALFALIAAGYFADDPTDFDSTFWQCAAGEETESNFQSIKPPPCAWPSFPNFAA